jgi:uncharacterized protein (DUF3084 family)
MTSESKLEAVCKELDEANAELNIKYIEYDRLFDEAEKIRQERDEAQTKLKEATELMKDAMWQLMTFLKPADTKTKNIIHALYHATDTMDNCAAR